MANISGGTRIVTDVENQELIQSIREVEHQYHPHLRFLDKNLRVKLREITIDVETPCHIRINDGSPVYVKDYYSNQNVTSIVVLEPGIEVIMAYII